MAERRQDEPAEPQRESRPAACAVQRPSAVGLALSLAQAAGNRAVTRLMRTPASSSRWVSPQARAQLASAGTSPGQALPDGLRDRLETSLGADLGGVRLHTGGPSSDAAASVGALACTVGQDVHFAAGRYDPASTEGQRLIAHEVAHTVQQATGTSVPQTGLEVSDPEDVHEREADDFATAFVVGGAAALTRAKPVVARTPSFTPTFGGQAGIFTFKNLNADVALGVNVRNARSAPRGTTLTWMWGRAVVDGVVRGDITPATGPSAVYHAKAARPTQGQADVLGADVEVAVPGGPPAVHAVTPPLRVAVLTPTTEVTQKVVPGPVGVGGSAIKPGDLVEFRFVFDHVERPQAMGVTVTPMLVSAPALYLSEIGGVKIGDDEPFQLRSARWDGDVLVQPVYCHHAGAATLTLRSTVGVSQPVSTHELKAEAGLQFFLDRCGVASDRHRALLAAVDTYIHGGFLNYKQGYEAAQAAFSAYAARQKLTSEILLGILFAAAGGAAGGAVGGAIKSSVEQMKFGEVTRKALLNASQGAVTDAAKDTAKFVVRLGQRLATGGGGSGGHRPDDATPMLAARTPADAGDLKVDPLNWYASVQRAKSEEETRLASILQQMKSRALNALVQGSTTTVDFDPVNVITQATRLDGTDVVQLGTPPSAAAYEKNMWEGWIHENAYTLRQAVGCGAFGVHVEDNVAKELRAEMERVAKVLATKGIEASWLTEALDEAKGRAEEAARKSRGLP